MPLLATHVGSLPPSQAVPDLEEYARNKGLENVSQVWLAYKERNGEVSVLAKKEPARVLEVAVADGVQTVRISLE